MLVGGPSRHHGSSQLGLAPSSTGFFPEVAPPPPSLAFQVTPVADSWKRREASKQVLQFMVCPGSARLGVLASLGQDGGTGPSEPNLAWFGTKVTHLRTSTPSQSGAEVEETRGVEWLLHQHSTLWKGHLEQVVQAGWYRHAGRSGFRGTGQARSGADCEVFAFLGDSKPPATPMNSAPAIF